MNQHDQERIDARIDTPRREGLTGTAPVELYQRVGDTDDITRAPDGRPLDQQPKWRRGVSMRASMRS